MLRRIRIPMAALAMLGLSSAFALAGKPLKLTVSVTPSTIQEGSTATGTVTHDNTNLGSSVTVALGSSDMTEATVAVATVTIPSGTNRVNFTVTAINDGITDGSQPVTITTSATGYASASTNVTVKDAPTFQYVLTFPELPIDAAYGPTSAWDLNNRGQMVGRYNNVQGRKAYIYDPSLSSRFIDLTALNLPTPSGMPPGYQLTTVLGINEHQVLVGYLTNDFGASGDRIACAVDWAAVNRVVDLLPDMGSSYSMGWKINENGDILGVYTDELGAYRGYIFNPGLYHGDPLVRAARDGMPLDLSNETPSALPRGDSQNFSLNNPVGNSPAQVAGTNENGIAFRYTTGLNPSFTETFSQIEMASSVGGINDAGTFCGVLKLTTVVKRRTQTQDVPFRFKSTVEHLPAGNGWVSAKDINNHGDLCGAESVYRDTWGWRHITDLPVIGQPDDLLLWFSSFPDPIHISDRVTSDDVGHITGHIRLDPGVHRTFVL